MSETITTAADSREKDIVRQIRALKHIKDGKGTPTASSVLEASMFESYRRNPTTLDRKLKELEVEYKTVTGEKYTHPKPPTKKEKEKETRKATSAYWKKAGPGHSLSGKGRRKTRKTHRRRY
jgi:hypothetical protein